MGGRVRALAPRRYPPRMGRAPRGQAVGILAMRSKELRAKRFTLVQAARMLSNKSKPTGDELRKADAMMNEAERLKAQIDRIERSESVEAENLEARRNGGTKPRRSAD